MRTRQSGSSNAVTLTLMPTPPSPASSRVSFPFNDTHPIQKPPTAFLRTHATPNFDLSPRPHLSFPTQIPPLALTLTLLLASQLTYTASTVFSLLTSLPLSTSANTTPPPPLLLSLLTHAPLTTTLVFRILDTVFMALALIFVLGAYWYRSRCVSRPNSNISSGWHFLHPERATRAPPPIPRRTPMHILSPPTTPTPTRIHSVLLPSTPSSPFSSSPENSKSPISLTSMLKVKSGHRHKPGPSSSSSFFSPRPKRTPLEPERDGGREETPVDDAAEQDDDEYTIPSPTSSTSSPATACLPCSTDFPLDYDKLQGQHHPTADQEKPQRRSIDRASLPRGARMSPGPARPTPLPVSPVTSLFHLPVSASVGVPVHRAWSWAHSSPRGVGEMGELPLRLPLPAKKEAEEPAATETDAEEGDCTDLRDPFAPPPPSAYRPVGSDSDSGHSAGAYRTYRQRRSSEAESELGHGGQRMRMSEWGRLPLPSPLPLPREQVRGLRIEKNKSRAKLRIDTTTTVSELDRDGDEDRTPTPTPTTPTPTSRPSPSPDPTTPNAVRFHTYPRGIAHAHAHAHTHPRPRMPTPAPTRRRPGTPMPTLTLTPTSTPTRTPTPAPAPSPKYEDAGTLRVRTRRLQKASYDSERDGTGGRSSGSSGGLGGGREDALLAQRLLVELGRGA
ncbi:hypothetical protein C0991_002499 [Blastosporella zonata]|nr:hypothetical protein C0991_002499 [Blastosporella zonata]